MFSTNDDLSVCVCGGRVFVVCVYVCVCVCGCKDDKPSSLALWLSIKATFGFLVIEGSLFAPATSMRRECLR